METTGRKKTSKPTNNTPRSSHQKNLKNGRCFRLSADSPPRKGCHFLVIVVLAVHLDVVQGMLRSCYGGVGGVELITFLCSAWWLWCHANKCVWAKIGLLEIDYVCGPSCFLFLTHCQGGKKHVDGSRAERDPVFPAENQQLFQERLVKPSQQWRIPRAQPFKRWVRNRKQGPSNIFQRQDAGVR